MTRFDVATYVSFRAAKNGTWTPGNPFFVFNNDGGGYAVDDNNKAILSDAAKAKAEAAKADIISGKIVVHDYMSDNKCPV